MAAIATAILRGLTAPEHLESVLSRGADVADLNFRDPLGRLLIHIAADSNEVSAMRWLVNQHGADPRATTAAEGNTALHVAASEGHLEAVTYLLEDTGVGVAGVNHAGETALDIAVTGGFDTMVRLMTRHLRSPLPPPPAAAASSIRSASDMDPKPKGKTIAVDEITQSVGKAGLSPRRDGQHRQREKIKRKVVDSSNDKKTGAPAPDSKKAGGRTPPFDGRGVTKGGFFVAGAWSKAGVCSCFNIRHRHLLGKHGVVFDMGVCPSEVVHVQHIFISHGHLDHCGAIVSHARLRHLASGPPAKYYMHAELAEGMEKVRRAFEGVEGDSISMDIVAIGPDDSVDLGQGCFVRPFLVQHRVQALGFALVRRRAEGLKREYCDLDGKALGALKKRGVEVSNTHETVEVVYTGDTVMAPLLSLPQVWSARLLIMEVTYLDGDGTAAAKNHHIHVKDVLDNIDKLRGVEQLVVAHVSERHGTCRHVLKLLADALPPSAINKISVALGEFGAPEHLTFLEDYVLEVKQEEIEAEEKEKEEEVSSSLTEREFVVG